MYITVKQAAEKWGISDRRVRILCFEGKIPGAYQEGRAWKIPYDATKPTDKRYKTTKSLIPVLEKKLVDLKARRPLTEGELERLNEEFLTEYTYNSNAIEGNTLTKDSKKSPTSISGRWIAFFVKKIEKRILLWYNFCINNDKISKEIIKNNIQNQKEV